MEGQEETLELVPAKAGRIHARIDRPKAPQINDPRAPDLYNTDIS